MRKPILFHDIDGVLFGDYNGHFQLRPDVKGWLHWASAHYQIVWLTTWQHAEIKTLLSVLYCEKYLNALEAPSGLRVTNWYQHDTKEEWLFANRAKLAEVGWFWIDDDRPTDERLRSLGLETWRCVSVNPKGADALVELQSRLTQLLDSLPV